MTGFRMRLNVDSDRDIIEWLKSQTDKTLAVKRAIRSAIHGRDEQEESNGAVVDLIAIRQVIESVFDEKLQGLIVGTAQKQGDDALDNKLDGMF
jgi:hypothetical protein